MLKKMVILVLLGLGFWGNGHAQRASIPNISTSNYQLLRSSFNGMYDSTDTNNENLIWGTSNSYPLEFFLKRGEEASMQWHRPWHDETDYDKNFIGFWNAVWYKDSIYFFIEIKDNQFNDDDTLSKMYDEDDGIVFWFDSQRNLQSCSWAWDADYNYLIHFKKDTIFTQLDASGKFGAIDTIARLAQKKPLFARHVEASDSIWSIEIAMPPIGTGKNRTNPEYYAVPDCVWFNMSYNDAENDGDSLGNYARKRQNLFTLEATTKGKPQWQQPGKLVMSPEVVATTTEMFACQQNIVVKNYLIDKIEIDSLININGVLNETAWKYAVSVILTSYRSVYDSSFTWKFWDNFSDAAVIWRSFWNIEERKLYLGFQIYDNYLDANSLSNGDLINDDGLLIWVDYNFNKKYDANDVNILIHNNDSINIYRRLISDTTDSEIYHKDSTYTQQNIQFAINRSPATHDWFVELELTVPEDTSHYASKGFPIEIGYNDADLEGVREHQLVWNTVSPGKKPWALFDNLGNYHFTTRPLFFVAFPDSSRPIFINPWANQYIYTHTPTVTISWSEADDPQSGIDFYHLQIGTTKEDNDIVDKLFFNVLEYTFQFPVDSTVLSDTLYARIQARNGFNLLSRWEYKTIVYDITAPTIPGTPLDQGNYTCSPLVNFSWTPSFDGESGVVNYHLQVGTTIGNADIYDNWLDDSDTTFSVTGSDKQTLFARIRAKNGAGLISEWSEYSDGITIDTTVASAPGAPRDSGKFTSSNFVIFNWMPASDPESGIIDYFLQVGTTPGDSNIYNDWIENNDTAYTVKGSAGQTLFARVRAKNGAGSIGPWSGWSDGITILPIDIVFAFDLSKNMTAYIDSMKYAVKAIVDSLVATGIDTSFGIVSFIDYPGTHNSCSYAAQYGTANDYPWKIDQVLTNDTSLVKNIINGLRTYSGEDGAQAYTRALLECLFLNWHPNSRKFVVMIGNAPPHDCDFFSTSYGKDPGPDAQLDTWDDLNYKKIVDWVNRAGITVISIDNGTATDSTLDYEGDIWKNLDYMASKTGGRHLMKNNWQEIPAAIEELVAQGLKSDSLFYPWIAEAEEMLNRSPYFGNACDNGWRLTYSDHPIYSGVVFLKDSLYQFTIRTKAEIANEAAPWLLVQVGNGFKGTCEIKNTEWQDYAFIAAIPKGYHCLSLTFLNDWWVPGVGDRNLLIDNVTVKYDTGRTEPMAYVFEAEEMSHHSEGSSQNGNYWELNKQYANIAHDYYFEKPELKCKIFASADSAANGWPAMDVYLDENIITSFPVNDTANAEYQFTLTGLKAGKHRIKIAYNNACYHRGRNLYIDKLVIYVNDRGLLKSLNEKSNEEQTKIVIPDKYDLDQNYPNPFNPATYIKYQLPENTHVSIKIFNTMGQEIRALVNEERGAGYYTTHWDGLDNHGNRVGTGIYLYHIRANDFICTRKLVLLK